MTTPDLSFKRLVHRKLVVLSFHITGECENDEMLRKEKEIVFFGHTFKEGSMEDLITTANIEGIRDRGR